MMGVQCSIIGAPKHVGMEVETDEMRLLLPCRAYPFGVRPALPLVYMEPIRIGYAAPAPSATVRRG